MYFLPGIMSNDDFGKDSLFRINESLREKNIVSVCTSITNALKVSPFLRL